MILDSPNQIRIPRSLGHTLHVSLRLPTFSKNGGNFTLRKAWTLRNKESNLTAAAAELESRAQEARF